MDLRILLKCETKIEVLFVLFFFQDPAISSHQAWGSYAPYDDGLALGIFINDQDSYVIPYHRDGPGVRLQGSVAARKVRPNHYPEARVYNSFDGLLYDF